MNEHPGKPATGHAVERFEGRLPVPAPAARATYTTPTPAQAQRLEQQRPPFKPTKPFPWWGKVLLGTAATVAVCAILLAANIIQPIHVFVVVGWWVMAMAVHPITAVVRTGEDAIDKVLGGGK